MGPQPRVRIALSLLLSALLLPVAAPLQAGAAGGSGNFFVNPSFEMGREGWRMDKAGSTAARFAVDSPQAADGRYSALVSIDSVAEWGTQFGQSFEAGKQGKTYTFAAVARSTKGPVTVRLEIERSGKPWDRVARTDTVTLTVDKWTELHVTFKLDKPFPEGWFAYMSCTQPNAEYRVDLFRLYEGDYVPYGKATREETLAASVALFDTGSRSAAPLSAEALAKRAGWTKLPEDETAHKFAGDAAFVNDRLAVVLRGGGPGAEVYSKGDKGFTLRATLAPAPGVPLASFAIAENSPSAVALDGSFKGADGKPLGVRFELGMGQAFVKAEARGAAQLSIDAPCRFAVLPDFFADDIVVDATHIPVDAADLPSENFLLRLLGDGEAVVMSVASARDEDVAIALAGKDADRVIRRTDIQFGKDGKVWVAALEAPGIWHRHEFAKADTGKVVRLDWKAPFPAQWRFDWTRADNGLMDSWEMIAQKAGGEFIKYGVFGSPGTLPANRKRWTTVLGTFQYPCWLDQAGQAYAQPLKGVVRFEGPALIYPVNRIKETPLNVFTVADVARATLGVGPCEYILDLEGQGYTYKGRATCSTRDTLGAIYAAKQQKQKRAEIEKVLEEVMVFVRHIRGRIESYVDFGHKLLATLDEQKKAHPELAGFCDQMAKLTRAIDAYVEKRKDEIKTPDYVAGLTDKFRKTVMDYEGDDALARCKAITEAIVVVGGNQDELVGECRMAVRIIRQQAGLAMATDPRVADLATEIRRRAQAVLRNAAGHESPRH